MYQLYSVPFCLFEINSLLLLLDRVQSNSIAFKFPFDFIRKFDVQVSTDHCRIYIVLDMISNIQ